MRNDARKRKSDELAPLFDLLREGIAGIIPLQVKAAFWQNWQTRAVRDELRVRELREEFGNLGAVLGPCVLVVDCDTPEAEANLAAAGVVLPSTRTHRTARGTHHFFCVPEGITVRSRGGIVPGVDVKHGNSYVVVPPSIHPSGAPTWSKTMRLSRTRPRR